MMRFVNILHIYIRHLSVSIEEVQTKETVERLINIRKIR